MVKTLSKGENHKGYHIIVGNDSIRIGIRYLIHYGCGSSFSLLALQKSIVEEVETAIKRDITIPTK
jgi:hypothetical protein